MKYTAILNDIAREIEIVETGPERFLVTIDGVSHEVDAHACSADSISLLIDNRSYDLSFSFDDDFLQLNFWNQYFNLEILDERKLRMRKVRSELDISGPETIRSSMPGKVVKVLVSEGEAVAPGTGIIIIEAMKMENEIQCKNSGIIRKVNVTPGENIEANVVLVEIEPES